MLLRTRSSSTLEQQQIFLRTFGKIDPIALGSALAVVVSFALVSVTLLTVLQNTAALNQQFNLIGKYLPGFQTTFPKSLWSIPYGLIIGFSTGFFFATARNVAARIVLNFIELSNFTAAIDETHDNLN